MTCRLPTMRPLLIALFILLAMPAAAQADDGYANARFGYSISVPDGFVVTDESDNGDGRSFYKAQGAQGLLVWGANLQEDFESEVAAAQDYAMAENGLKLTYTASTPRWASFSGTSGSRLIYQRMVLLCDGTSYAAFRIQYSQTDIAAMNATIDRLVQSLKPNAC